MTRGMPWKSVVKTLIAGACVLAPAGRAAWAYDPIGQQAHYLLDKNPDRTSRIVKSGDADTTATGYLADAAGGPAYRIELDYRVSIVGMGTKTGTSHFDVPAEYFTEEFMERLRVTGYYETPKMKIRHLGFRDAANLDGQQYDHCDYLYFYDIDTSRSEIQDLEIWAHVKAGVPVIGAVKLDSTGRLDGQKIKAGADYMVP